MNRSFLKIEKVLTNLKDGVKKAINKDLGDNELAHWAGYPDLKSFREAIAAEIHVEKLRTRRHNLDHQVSEHLLKNIKVEVPKSEVEHYHKEVVERELYNFRLRGVPEKDLEKYKKDIEEKAKGIAEEQIKISYII